MDTLAETSWDVLISGTGIQQSLLALALSRGGKKVLHVDKNDVYGSSEAALSLQEAERWTENVNSATWRSPFSNASITHSTSDGVASKLASSRAYNLSLAPTLLYTQSALLPILVSSRAHQQLEFQALGSWFVYDDQNSTEETQDGVRKPGLVRVPNGREDIFADQTLSLKAKGALMKFIRFVAVYETKPEVWETRKDMPFPDFLSQHFNLPPASHGPLLALCLSSSPSEATSTGFALPRIARHLRSIGMFGPGFGSVIPKWGGLSEVAQVACRAGAVGGGVYVLGKQIESIEAVQVDEEVEEIPRPGLSQEDISKEVSDAIGASNFLPTDEGSLNKFEAQIEDQSLEELLAAAGYSVGSEESSETTAPTTVAKGEPPHTDSPKEIRKLSVRLEGGDTVTTNYVVGTLYDLPEGQQASTIAPQSSPASQSSTASRSVSIVSASLPALYPRTVEGGVTPAGAVIVFPPGSLAGVSQSFPVNIIAHTGDTGECPQGQTVLYASIASSEEDAFLILDQAVNALLTTQGSDAEVVWRLQYQQSSDSSKHRSGPEDSSVLRFPDTPLDLAFDDGMLDNVKEAWRLISGEEVDKFMKFEDRQASEDNFEDED